jgi:hypothetical protein
VLYAATAQLGVLDHPEYVGHEYMEDGTEYCDVMVHNSASDRFPEMRPWCVTGPICPTPISLLPVRT